MIDVWVKVYNSNEGVEDEKKKSRTLHCIAYRLSICQSIWE